MRRRLARALGTALATVAWATGSGAEAGGGPSRTLVVVNENSPTSLHVANVYAAARGIPASHILRLASVPQRQRISIHLLRERVLLPIETFLVEQGLERSIDTIAFSTEFPYAADHSSDGDGAMGDSRVPKVASLTGLATLSRRTLAKDIAYSAMDANRYGRVGPGGPRPSQGFRCTYVFDKGGGIDKEPEAAAWDEHRDRYRLATLLAWHGTQGMTVPEILVQLARSVAADGTRPDGTVYLMNHPDVRAQTRKPFFTQTSEALAARGRRSIVLAPGEEGQDGVLPLGKSDAIGCVAGIAAFDWSRSGSTLLPGALAEHLTSFGAQLDGSGQTKCIEFLRAGAAGSSGTVCEPLSIWQKFPAPFLHVFYADGCSLAEAFYQSIMGPYQLLVVGDPLCRPFATIVVPSVAAEMAKSPWKGTVALAPQVPEGAPDMAAFEVHVDGRMIAAAAPGTPIELDTTTWEDGHHDLEVAAVEAGDVETRSELAWSILVANGSERTTLGGPKKGVRLDEDVALSGTTPRWATQVEIRHGRNVLLIEKVRSGRFKATLPATRLGQGRVPLLARAVGTDEAAVRSNALWIEVLPPRVLGPKKSSGRAKAKADENKGPAKGKAGFAVAGVDADGKTFESVASHLGWAAKQKLADGLPAGAANGARKLTLTGEIEAPVEGTYQLALLGYGKTIVRVHGQVVFESDLANEVARYADVALAAGWHPMEIQFEPAGAPRLVAKWGGAIVPEVLGGTRVRH